MRLEIGHTFFRARKIAAAAVALSVGTVLLSAEQAHAWNSRGHMEVAAVAWSLLTPEAKQRASDLIQLNPLYKTWVKGVPAASRSKTAFVMAATWPDIIKRKAGYENDGENPQGADASRNIGYSDKLQHRYWHYVDYPFSPDGTPLEQPKVPNAEVEIAAFRSVLSSNASDDLKSYDLVWLLHLVGDVHQPLHATSRFTSALPDGDRGGNSVTLCKKPCKNELHAFWDGLRGANNAPRPAITAAGKLDPAPNNEAQIKSEKAWVQESFQIAKDAVYQEPVGPGKGPYTLSKSYTAQAKAIAAERVALAGARLANLINENLR